jgi:type II secretion system protein J
MMRLPPPIARRPGAFTLIEVLLSVMIFATVLLAINIVFFSALRLHRRTTNLIENSLPVERALAVMRRDLLNTLSPSPFNVLAASFKNGLVGSGTIQSSGLEFFTTTGQLSDEAPWGDVQKVTYQLMDPTTSLSARGKDLVRSVSRNLLSPSATTDVPEDQQHLLSGVATAEFACFDGSTWRNAWDTTLGDSGLPRAVRVRLQMVAEDPDDLRNQPPIDLLVPLNVQPVINTNLPSGGTP